MSGYQNGEAYIWKRKSSKPESALDVGPKGRPVKNIHYTSIGGQKFVTLVGGGSNATDPCTVTFQMGKQKLRQTLNFHVDVIQSILLYKEPYKNGAYAMCSFA
jgi:hypothetical protein